MDRPKPGDEKDAGTSEVLLPPAIEAMPDRTPLTTVKAQGTTDGSRIVTQGSPAGTLVTVVLPGGSFCQDTPL
ncbi:MAG TPA: hypothetical protein VKZ63_00275, partial [Kofleriaceae bacterium]|nr:hypothetical protein [Kofleriaceae bacterium]